MCRNAGSLKVPMRVLPRRRRAWCAALRVIRALEEDGCHQAAQTLRSSWSNPFPGTNQGRRMPAGEGLRDRRWWALMLLAALLLAIGSLVLLSGLLFFLTAYGIVFVVPFAAVSTHLAAWVLLGLAITILLPKGAIRYRLRLVSAFLASIGEFGLGLLLVALAFPEDFGRILLIFFFPYFPWVFGPVVLAHGVLFRISSNTLRKRSSRYAIVVGSWALILLAAVALVAWTSVFLLEDQVLSLLGLAGLGRLKDSILILGGLSGLGYATIAVGWWMERMNGRTDWQADIISS